jgi:hypothetical protein
MYIRYLFSCIRVCWPLQWSNGQSSWLQIQRSVFDSLHYQIFWVLGLKRGPLSQVSAIVELLGRKSSGSDLETWKYGSRDPSRWPRGTIYPQKLAITWPYIIYITYLLYYILLITYIYIYITYILTAKCFKEISPVGTVVSRQTSGNRKM